MKFKKNGGIVNDTFGRSPHGERGLKLHAREAECETAVSLSSRRAWIEIVAEFNALSILTSSLSSRRAWIEI